MTDEMQIQQQRPSALPYALGGAAVGGVGGWATNEFILKKKMSHEDIIAEINSQDKFESRIKDGAPEASSWKDAQTKANEIKKLEADLEALPEKVLPEDAIEAKNLKAAIDAKEAEISRRVAEEMGNSGKATSFPTRKALEEGLSKKEFAMIEPYLNRYENARKSLLGKPGNKMVGSKVQKEFEEVGKARKALNKFYDDAFNVYDGLSDKNKAKFDPLKNSSTNLEINKLVDASLPGTGYHSYDYKQFIEMQEKFGADIFDISETAVSGATKKVKNPATGKDVWVTVDKDALKAARENMRNEYAANIHKAIEYGEKRKGFDKEFFEANKEALGDLRTPIKKAKDLGKLKSPKDYTQLLKSIEVIELTINNKLETYPIDLGSGLRFKNADDLARFKAQMQLEKDLAIKRAKESSALKQELNSIINSDITVKTAKEKLEQKIAKDSGVKKAINSLEDLNRRFSSQEKKDLYAKVKAMLDIEPTANEAEIRERITKALEGGSYDKKIENCQALYDKAAAKNGTSNSAAREALEKQISGAKDDLKRITDNIAKKCKAGGTKTWIAAGVGAVALGLAGLALRPKAKDA